MFAVSRCPACGRLHGLEIPVKTTSCRLCGKRYDPSKGSVLRSFGSDKEMRAFLQGVASFEGGSEEPLVDQGSKASGQPPSISRPGKSRMVKLIIAKLSEGPRSWSDLSPISEDGTGVEMLEECLELLLEQGSIFKMRDGRYALVR